MDKIYLSLEEAQTLILSLKKDLIKLMRLNKMLSLLNSVEIEYEDDYRTLTQEILFNKKFHKLSYNFYTLLDKLYKKGCFVKDINKGVIDFYSFFEGREIFLCWKISEEEIKYWHEVDVGYSARKPVSMIKKTLKNKE